MTIRANILFQKFFHPLHALFVLDLGKRIFHRVNGVEIGEVQFSGLTGVFVVIKNVLFLRRTVEHDVLFFVGQLAKRHIRAYPHLAANVCHQ